MKSNLVKADYWHLEEQCIKCDLCPNTCILTEGNYGKCNVRLNSGGALYTENYGMIAAIALDPIEKKPLKQYKPNSKVLSIGSYGCNFNCGFCQNWQISQTKPLSKYFSPEKILETALNYKQHNNIGVAYTYAEATVWYEFVYDCARLVKESGLDNILISNGYINKEPLLELAPLIDAANIDLKAFNEEFYNNICGGSLKSVLNTIETLHSYCHVEITTLIIPGENDTEEEITKISKYIASIDKNIPLHLSRYFPNYKFETDATSISTIKKLHDIAKEYLVSVYVGNA